MKNKLTKKIVGGVVFGALLATSVGGAFAATSAATSAGNGNMRPQHGMAGQRENPLQSVLAKLVSDGSITQEKVDAMKAYMDANKPSDLQQGTQKKGMFADLVQAGTITEIQQSKLEEALQALRPSRTEKPSDTSGQAISREKMESARTAEIKTALDKLVSDSVMTQATADAVAAQCQTHKGMFDELVQKGTLTQEQQTKIEEAMQALRPDGEHEKKGNSSAQAISFEKMQTQRTSEMKTILDKLVADSTMNQSTADAVLTSMTDKMKEMEQNKATNDANKATMQQNRVNMLDEMVTKGIITDAEKTTIEAAVKAAHPAVGEKSAPNDVSSTN